MFLFKDCNDCFLNISKLLGNQICESLGKNCSGCKLTAFNCLSSLFFPKCFIKLKGNYY